MVTARAGRGNGELLLSGGRVSVWGMKTVLEMDGSNGGTTV